MSLPAKALGILIDFKKELLSREVATARVQETSTPEREPKPQRMRHARKRGEAFQRFCRRRNW